MCLGGYPDRSLRSVFLSITVGHSHLATPRVMCLALLSVLFSTVGRHTVILCLTRKKNVDTLARVHSKNAAVTTHATRNI